MKWSTAILSLGIVATNVQAAPLETREDLQLFKLKIHA
jgi:hypothetical protein